MPVVLLGNTDRFPTEDVKTRNGSKISIKEGEQKDGDADITVHVEKSDVQASKDRLPLTRACS